MPPRLNLLASCRALVLRPRTHAGAAQWRPPPAAPLDCAPLRRAYSTTELPPSIPSTPPPPPPELSLDEEKLVALSTLSASRPLEQIQEDEGPVMDNDEALRQLEMISYGINGFDAKEIGHKYGLPELPIAPDMSMKHRYSPLLIQITNLLMRDGKKSKAQRDMAQVLNYLRTFPTPRYSPSHPLMPGKPPASHLPLDPVTYITLALDSVAPLVKIRNFAGLAGGGKALPVPVPLAIRQRRRQAFMWILDNVNKKHSRGSGKKQLAHRIAEEVVAIVEGKSSLWEKRLQIHKMGTTSRANVQAVEWKRKRK